MAHPRIIQGGMGVAISSWTLARAVSSMGQLGVVSGVGLDLLLSRRLQDGDPGGHYRRALEHFPIPEIARRVLAQHFIPGGRRPHDPYRRLPMYTESPSAALQQLTVVANFAEVFLAKEGHEGSVGINYLEKMQLPTLPSLYGAMLGGVDYVLMGAGIPREIPGILDGLSEHREVFLSLHVEGATSADSHRLRFDPRAVVGEILPVPRRPHFLAIVASNVLATTMARKSTGRVDGFVIEGPTAGGHNAPPRGPLTLNGRGEPVYGPRDEVDLGAIKALGLPFWLAGGYGRPEMYRRALELGAVGIQVGTPFAFCRESGLKEEYKQAILRKSQRGEAGIFTDPVASPTGFPFKVVLLEETLSDPEVYRTRPRICDLGYLRHPYRKDDASVGFRCPAEPVKDYVKKGGAAVDALGRKCLCNALLSNAGFAQHQDSGYVEKPLVTSGDDVAGVARFLRPGEDSFSARDVIQALLG